MNDKSKLEQYVEAINADILPFIDYGELQASYSTDMVYAKGVLNRLHEAMTAAYGGEQLHEQDGDEGFVVIPGVLRGKESGSICVALLELDLSSSGEHWGTTYLCKYGAIPQSSNDMDFGNDHVLKSEIQEINAAFIPYDYCYTASITNDIHVRHGSLPDELKGVLADFRNHRAVLLHEEKPSVVGRLREAAKEVNQITEQTDKPKKPGPEL